MNSLTLLLRWPVAGLTCVALAILLGCATDSPLTPTSTMPASPRPTVSTADLPPSTDNSAQPVAVGTKVGNRIPDFALDLVDGTTVTSDDLIKQNRPTFLFFFASW